MDEVQIKLTVDNSQVINSLQQTEQAYKKVGDTAKQGLLGEKGLIEDLRQTIDKYRQARDKAQSIEGIEKYNRKIQEATNDLKKYEQAGIRAFDKVKNAAGGFGQVIGRIGGMMAAAFSVGAVLSFAKKGFSAYQEQLKGERQLLFALKDRKDAMEGLLAQSEVLSQQTGIPNEVLNRIQALAATYGLTTEQIRKLTAASTDLAAVQGVDVETAARTLLGTFEGTIGRMGKLDDGFKKLTDTQLKQGVALDIVAEKFGGFGKAAVFESDRARIAWSEFAESFGKIIFPAVSFVLERLSKGLQVITKGVRKIKEEQNIVALQEMDMAAITNQRLYTQEKIYEQQRKVRKLQDDGASGVAIARERQILHNMQQESVLIEKQIEVKRKEAKQDKELKETKSKALVDYTASLKSMSQTELEFQAKKYTNELEYIDVIKQEQDRRKQATESVKKDTEERVKASSDLVEATRRIGEEYTKMVIQSSDALTASSTQRRTMIAEIKKQFDETVEIAKKAGEQVPAEYLQAMEGLLAANEKEFQESVEKILLPPKKPSDATQQQWDAYAKKVITNVVDSMQDVPKERVLTFDGKVVLDIEPLPPPDELGVFNIWTDILGLNKNDKEQFEKDKEYILNSIGEIANSVMALTQVYVDAARQRREALDQQVADAEQELQEKEALKEEGIRIDTTAEQKKLEAVKEEREKALAEEQKAMQLQFKLDTAMQLSSLITASANILKTWSTVPFGQILGIAAITAMFAAFAAAKKQAAAQIFEEGGRVDTAKGQRIAGPRHSAGGVQVEAEGGEWIVNRRASQRYDSLLEAINSEDIRKVERHAATILEQGQLHGIDVNETLVESYLRGEDMQAHEQIKLITDRARAELASRLFELQRVESLNAVSRELMAITRQMSEGKSRTTDTSKQSDRHTVESVSVFDRVRQLARQVAMYSSDSRAVSLAEKLSTTDRQRVTENYLKDIRTLSHLTTGVLVTDRLREVHDEIRKLSETDRVRTELATRLESLNTFIRELTSTAHSDTDKYYTFEYERANELIRDIALRSTDNRVTSLAESLIAKDYTSITDNYVKDIQQLSNFLTDVLITDMQREVYNEMQRLSEVIYLTDRQRQAITHERAIDSIVATVIDSQAHRQHTTTQDRQRDKVTTADQTREQLTRQIVSEVERLSGVELISREMLRHSTADSHQVEALRQVDALISTLIERDRKESQTDNRREAISSDRRQFISQQVATIARGVITEISVHQDSQHITDSNREDSQQTDRSTVDQRQTTADARKVSEVTAQAIATEQLATTMISRAVETLRYSGVDVTSGFVRDVLTADSDRMREYIEQTNERQYTREQRQAIDAMMTTAVIVRQLIQSPQQVTAAVMARLPVMHTGGQVGTPATVGRDMPVILQGGEFVVNSRSAERHREILQAINTDTVHQLRDLAPAGEIHHTLERAVNSTRDRSTQVLVTDLSGKLKSIDAEIRKLNRFFADREEMQLQGGKMIRRRGNQTIITNLPK